MENAFCNNCGKTGHLYSQCKIPITSIGVIAFRYINNEYQYLLIRRKETLCFMDFMRGKYSIKNKEYILKMFKQMTVQEKELLLHGDFEKIWKNIWNDETTLHQYKNEYNNAKDKYEGLVKGIDYDHTHYSLASLIDEVSNDIQYNEPEWGFPKGRRNLYEKDYECAIREFSEETGYNTNHLHNIQNIMPLYEFITGSNYKSYKHKYFVMFMNNKDTVHLDRFQQSEVSKIEWMNIETALKTIRPYNVEKKKLIESLDISLKKTNIYSI